MGSCIFITLALFVFGNSVGSTEDTLRFVTVLFRHGDRSPVNAYPNDPHNESAWPQGFGQLSLEGMKQHFYLGQLLRKRYTGFLSESYSRFEIAVRSSDYDRTIMSAASNLAGLYHNDPRMIHPDLHWRPIPIHTVPLDEEKLLSFPMANCPRYEQLMNETENSEIYQKKNEENKDFLKTLRNKTGLDSLSLKTVWKVYDTLSAEEHNNLSLPRWVTPEVMKKLKVLNDFSYEIFFGIYKREEKCKLQGGVLLDRIIKNLTAAATLNSPQQLKMIMYSAHDTTILALQEALNVSNGLAPPFASCHIFELHQDPDGSFSVKMFYHNESSVAKLYNLTLPGCAHQCPLQEFIELTRSVIPKDWDEECQIKPHENNETKLLCSFLDNWTHEVPVNMSSSAYSIRLIQRPRTVIITWFNYKKQQKTLNVARRNEDVRYVNPRVIFFPDLSAETLQNRQYFARVKAQFRALTRCGMQAHVIIKYNKKCMSFKTIADAEAYIKSVRV
ncbi:lysosomal acid phosphatase-like isoform X2 [Clarias gariepinus]|uniref:lysosomal acid phosphatase-like isoform X2 n=1 Tax=Clarias gariepinus TaxID=13013 RepID=UPI00234CDF93|nr:lysosomal acid phosphatase-like isoform X2 [Clarias gariepinus]